MEFKREILICDCMYVDHQIIFTHDKEYQGENVVYMNIHLT